MAHAPVNLGAGGGSGSDDCTGTTAELLKGYTGILRDTDDEPVEGTLELTGNATAAQVLSGKTFYNTNAKGKLTGTLVVNSLLSFSAAAYSGRRVLAKWGNPTAATGKPYSGVYIRYSTSGNPGKTGGTQIYKGSGSSAASGATSQVYLDLPALSTKYYLSIYPYVTTSEGELTGTVLNTTVTTSAAVTNTYKASQTVTVPVGYTKMDVFCVGGGGGGAMGMSGYRPSVAGGGGGGGYTTTKTGIAVAAGKSIVITIGAGGKGGVVSPYTKATDGGATTVVYDSATTVSAAGGKAGGSTYAGGSGGSGGGSGAYSDTVRYASWNSSAGGSNGGNGGNAYYSYDQTSVNHGAGTGQGTTTRAFAASSGTIYSGAGGGGGSGSGYADYDGSSGGSTGGGHGGHGWSSYFGGESEGYTYYPPSAGTAGTANTGGGGGGGGAGTNFYYKDQAGANGGDGGSGIVLIKFY